LGGIGAALQSYREKLKEPGNGRPDRGIFPQATSGEEGRQRPNRPGFEPTLPKQFDRYFQL